MFLNWLSVLVLNGIEVWQYFQTYCDRENLICSVVNNPKISLLFNYRRLFYVLFQRSSLVQTIYSTYQVSSQFVQQLLRDLHRLLTHLQEDIGIWKKKENKNYVSTTYFTECNKISYFIVSYSINYNNLQKTNDGNHIFSLAYLLPTSSFQN